jgi:hypothetical protein
MSVHNDSSLFVLRDNAEMIRLDPISFDSEDEFQSLLERFPELIPGDQIDRSVPRRWLLIGREVGIPDSDEAYGRWSLDHLFIDQDGIPAFVEVKRHSDTRIRREVVGQMMDYAANAVTYWPADLIRSKFAATCQADGRDPSAALADFLGDDRDPADFWATVYANLRDGNVRLIFVADRVPAELQRIVEFLNERMSPTEVLAVEVQRYSGGGLTTHVPRVYGQTIEAQMVKRGETRKASGSKRRTWNENSFFEDAGRRLTAQQMQELRSLFQFFSEFSRIDWGTGTVFGSFNPKFQNMGNISPLTVDTEGSIWFKLSWMDREPANTFRKIYHQALSEQGVPMSGDYASDTVLAIAEWPAYGDAIRKATQAAMSRFVSTMDSRE